jgi:hypothetical protein
MYVKTSSYIKNFISDGPWTAHYHQNYTIQTNEIAWYSPETYLCLWWRSLHTCFIKALNSWTQNRTNNPDGQNSIKKVINWLYWCARSETTWQDPFCFNSIIEWQSEDSEDYGMASVNGFAPIQISSFHMGAIHVEAGTSSKMCWKIVNHPRDTGSAKANWISAYCDKGWKLYSFEYEPKFNVD